MNIKSVFTKKRVIILAVNLVCLTLSMIFSIVSDIQINGLTSQNGAEKWQNQNKDIDYTQISCFFSDDSGMTENSVDAIRNAIETAMTSASVKSDETSRLWIDTYTSTVGKYEVSGTKRGSAQTEIIAVTSDFFLIHDFDFVNGSYFHEEELSENGVVIDNSLAWQIFGSDDVIGMTVEINSVSFYVAGVVDIPRCDAEKKTYGNLPRAYITYNSAEKIGAESLHVECYEVVMPNPVKNYAYNAINDFVSTQYENTSHTVENTTRFSLSNNFRRLKELSDTAIIDNSVSFTWWENSARVTEIKVSLNLFAIIIFLIVPIITLIILLIKTFRFVKSKHILKCIFNKIKNKF